MAPEPDAGGTPVEPLHPIDPDQDDSDAEPTDPEVLEDPEIPNDEQGDPPVVTQPQST